MFNQGGYISEYQALSSRLKKKRILKKPNIAEAGEQFQNIALRSEGSGGTQTAGLCYRSAAKCAASLGHTRQETNHLVKAGRLFLKNEKALVVGGLISTGEDLHQGLHCYHEALDRLQGEDKLAAACIHFELGKKLAHDVSRPNAAIFELEKTLHLLKEFPLESMECSREIMSLHIKEGEYCEALKSCTDAIETLERIPYSGFKEDASRDLFIIRLLLLLIVEPAASQVSKKDAQFLEKFTWMDSVDGSGDLADLNSTLATHELSCIPPDIFLLLQSIVMIVQSCDIENAILVEAEICNMLSNQQRDLMRTLVRKLGEKIR